MVQLLGFQITRANDDREKPAEVKQLSQFTPDDGTTTISANWRLFRSILGYGGHG